MMKLETVFTPTATAILIEARSVDATAWELFGAEVRVIGKGGVIIAVGPLGEVGLNILPRLDKIEIFAVSEDRIHDVKIVPRKEKSPSPGHMLNPRKEV